MILIPHSSYFVPLPRYCSPRFWLDQSGGSPQSSVCSVCSILGIPQSIFTCSTVPMRWSEVQTKIRGVQARSRVALSSVRIGVGLTILSYEETTKEYHLERFLHTACSGQLYTLARKVTSDSFSQNYVRFWTTDIVTITN